MELKDVKKPDYGPLYSFKEVMEFIGVSRCTLYRMMKQGKIKGINVSKTGTKAIWFFRAEDVQEYYDNIASSINGSKTINQQDICGNTLGQTPRA